uniref:Uncharacterized protein n=1 Tax=Oryza brachyantha TaxID=4533 RepID=J3MFA6_ORYBR
MEAAKRSGGLARWIPGSDINGMNKTVERHAAAYTGGEERIMHAACLLAGEGWVHPCTERKRDGTNGYGRIKRIDGKYCLLGIFRYDNRLIFME